MRVLLVCQAGDGMLDLALRAQRAGHKVRMFLKTYDPRTRPVGKGLVELVNDWRAHVDWADLTILESNGLYMDQAEAFQKRGHLFIGGTPESAAWELDRERGMAVFKKAGIPVPSYRVFNDYDSAIAHVERHGVMYSKPCSDTADKSLSAKTGVDENPAWMLRKWKKKHGRPPSPFLLQEQISGVEFAVGAWFGPGGFSDDGFEENFEHKKLHAGDLGPNCGEAGTVMRYVKRSKLADNVLLPLEESLSRLGYVGNVDVNCIVDHDGTPWPLEFTMRCGWPSFNIELSMLRDDPCEFLAALASGENTRGAHRINEPAVGVVLALPPYPNPPRDYAELIGVPMYGDVGEVWHPCEMQKGEDGANFSSAGGYVGVATGRGSTVREAAKAAYNVLGHISMPANPFWRVDIGQRLRRDAPRLQEHGFALGLEY